MDSGALNSSPRLAIIGGFLGAGKTTCILQIAKYLLKQGKKVGIVTNDQGSDLVDTGFLQKEGLPVLEVTGGCFCCNFDEFTQMVGRLAEYQMPDIILAEPVGSCTDLVATIFKPLQLDYTNQFTLSPLSVVADPKRVRKLMQKKVNSNFPDEINYLFQKQLEEADLIILNKADLLTQSEIDELTLYLKDNFRGVEVMPVSAKDNIGIDRWVINITDGVAQDKYTLDIDYRAYARAEEYLGWLNSSMALKAREEFDFNSFIELLMNSINNQLKINNHEVAHLKIYAVSDQDWAKASITDLSDEPDFNRRMEQKTQGINLIINARVSVEPELLRPIVEQELAKLCKEKDINMSSLKTECFKPGKPVPKHRIIKHK